MKLVSTVRLKNNHKLEISTLDTTIGSLIMYSGDDYPEYAQVWTPTFDEFEELSNEVVWC